MIARSTALLLSAFMLNIEAGVASTEQRMLSLLEYLLIILHIPPPIGKYTPEAEPLAIVIKLILLDFGL
ncbi:hypothetical protein RLOatenuis_3360 [Rickettsiales bacterium]|nr:hypothetical protein RLOatenuis_3360 [Rickettsiales bacterium]